MDPNNPYGQPSAFPTPQKNQVDERTYRVAVAQRQIMWALLTNILINIGAVLITDQANEILAVFALVALGVIIFMVISVVSLARALNSTGTAVIFAIAMFIPCVSLIVLFSVNQQATGFLTGRGIKVGFMGADLRQFEGMHQGGVPPEKENPFQS